MNKQIFIVAGVALGIAALLATVIGRTGFAAIQSAPATAAARLAIENRPAADDSGLKRDVFISAARATRAPAIEAGGTWINSDARTLEKERGHVVVVDFWTFGCYNCRNTLPTVKRWDAKYREQGLTVIGVHTPESGYEKDLGNVRRAVREQNIRYPVVTDEGGDTWRAFGVEAWPTTVILDKQGRIRFVHIGEGMYDEMESVIQKLLAEEYKS